VARVGALLLSLLLSVGAYAAEITGEVKTQGAKRAGATFVYAEPLEPRAVRPGRFTMKQWEKEITPHVLVIPAGSTVDFPNQDPIFHNVFSRSRPGEFDLGLYRAGASKSVTFSSVNTYRVFCNIHPQMTAVIQVVPTSYIAEVDKSGHYRLEAPAGKYRVTAWSERAAQPSSVEVTVASAGATVPALTLDESKYVELPHKNKYGQDYPATYDGAKH
jgi:plastocyanin